MTRPHLSASQISTYLACGVRWERQYVRGERTPANGYMVRGSALDDAANLYYREKAKGVPALDVDEFVEAAVSSHQARLVGEEIELDVPEDQSKTMLAKAAGAYYAAIATKFTPRSVEDIQRKYVVALDDFDVVGYVDLITNAGAVVDTKLKARLVGDDELASNVQLSTYAWMTGATNLALAVAQPTGKATLQWTTRDAADVERVKRLYSRVWASIQLGVAVPASPESWNCGPRWCSFWASCPFGGQA